MRKFMLFDCVIVIIAMAIGAAGVFATNKTMWYQNEKSNDAYQFPVYHGKEELTYDKIVDSLQIPEDILKAMSTNGLVETCLNYPLFSMGMITSNDSLYAGFMKSRSEFNGLCELFIREDAGTKLLTLY